MRITVLGGGRVGRAIALDLAREERFQVAVADASRPALDGFASTPDVTPVQADLSDPSAVARVVEDADLVVGAVPGHMGLAVVRAVLEADRDIVDISFFPEDAYELDGLARDRGRTALVDCGVAPGCSNLILGHLEAGLDRVDRFECLVGGLPVDRSCTWEYKAPFSPIDVIEEYTRPARIRRNGRDVTMAALTEVETLDFPGVGRVEAFNTDGLRTLLRNSAAPDLVEKTVRYPGHADRMRALRDSGFFSQAPLSVGGPTVRPLDLTARLLFDAWQYEPGEADLTLMRVVVEGTEDGAPIRHVFTLLDRYDPDTDTSSMARTTGYTCTAMVRLVLSGAFSAPGVSPPEVVGAHPGCFDFVMDHLAERGVRFEHTGPS